MTTINQNPFDNDSPFLAPDEYNRGYKTWGDYLRDEAENGFLFECPACHAKLFIWLDCRRGELDRSCAYCGYSHRPIVQAELRQAREAAQAEETLHPGIVYVVLMLDELLHTDDQPMCADVTCPCHEAQAQAQQEGTQS